MLIKVIMLIMRIMVIVYDFTYFADYAYYGNYFDYAYYGYHAYYADYFMNSGPYRFGSCGSRVADSRQNKRTAIAQEVDGLGAQFRQSMRDGWLKYIKDTYAAQQAEAAIGPSIGQGKMVVDD